MPFSKLKLNDKILTSIAELGYTEPKEIQAAAFSRIMGGQDIVVSGPDGSGKTTLIALAILNKLKSPYMVAPRALVLVASKEKGQELEKIFRELGWALGLRIEGMYPREDLESQRERMREGVDVVIGTPDKILELDIRSGINFTQLKHFFVDDLDAIVKLNKQVIIKNLADPLGKCQFIFAANEINQKIERVVELNMINPTFFEVE